jgi:hypothetical protein
MAIWGISIIVSGLNSLSNDLDKATSGTGSAQATHGVIHQEDHLVYQALFTGNDL